MKNFHSLLTTFIFIHFQDILQGFLIGHLDEHFKNEMELDIFLYFKPISNRHLLLAIDRNNNSFTVMSGENFHKNFQLIIDFNGLNYSIVSQSANDLVFDEEIFQIHLQLLITNNNLCHLNSKTILLENIFSKPNPISFPDILNAYNFYREINKTNIFVGNVNNIQLNGTVNVSFTRIIGCIQDFYVNDRKVKFIQKGDYFYPYCAKRATESICEDSICRNRSVDYYILCCSLSGINAGRHCFKIQAEQSKSSYRIVEKESNIRIVKFAWMPKPVENECLIEVVTKNNCLITIYVNPSGEIILLLRNQQLEILNRTNLYKLQSNRTHVLIVKFVDSLAIIKISNGDFIKKIYYPSFKLGKYVKVGWSHNNDKCKPITSGFAFQYDPDHFVASIETIQENNCWLFIAISLLSTLLLVFVLASVLIKNRMTKKFSSISKINVYEEIVQTPEESSYINMEENQRNIIRDDSQFHLRDQSNRETAEYSEIVIEQ